MVYKKYVHKRGKKHGPYYYHSYREGNNIRKIYIGGREEYREWLKNQQEDLPEKSIVKGISRTTFFSLSKTKNKWLLFFFFAILLIIFGFFYQYQITGKITLNIKDSYILGENITGTLRLGLKKGELLPLDSKLLIEQNGTISEVPISNFIHANSNGSFYVENTELSGIGQGYGFSGEKKTYPTVFFKLKIYSEGMEEVVEEPSEEITEIEEPVGDGVPAVEEVGEIGEVKEEVTEIEEKLPEEEIEEPEKKVEEVPEEKPKEAAEEQVEQVQELGTEETTESERVEPAAGEISEQVSAGSEPETSPLTGEAVKEDEEEGIMIVDGSCSKDNPFSYELEKGKTAEIKKNSVEIKEIDEIGKIKQKKIDDDAVTLQISGREVRVTTDYSIKEKGFGKDFLQDDEHYIDINLNEFGVEARQGILTISLVYEETELAKVSEEILVEQPEIPENITEVEENISEINITIPEANISEINITNITIPEEIVNITNITIPEELVNITITNLSIIQEIGKIEINKNSNYTLNLNNYFTGAENYSIGEVKNLALLLENNNLVIIPDENFTGIRNSTIKAFSDDEFLFQDFSVFVVERNITIVNITALNITTKQYKTIINRPVKWIKTLKIENLTEIKNLTLDLPKQAQNITIKTGQEVKEAEQEIERYEQIINETDRKSLITGQVTGDVSLEIKLRKGFVTRIWEWLTSLRITGRVIQEEELKDKITETQDSKVIDLTEVINKTRTEEVGVEYYTEAPLAEETNISGGKKVVVSAPTELNYENILAYTLLDNKTRISINETEKIRLYWVRTIEEVKEISNKTAVKTEINVTEVNVSEVNVSILNETMNISEVDISLPKENVTVPENITEVNISEINVSVSNETIQDNKTAQEKQETIPITAFAALESIEETSNITKEANASEIKVNQTIRTIKQKVNFTAYDLDADGFIDYIEWIVPYLSEQTYEIIYITKAEHLDENRTFIEDIYDYVKERDNNWTTIPAEHYVRVTFEQNLTKDKDITIYARSSCSTNSSIMINETAIPCEIYKKKRRIDEIRRLLKNE